MTDRNGYSFHFAYDDQGRCIEEHGNDGLWRVALRYAPEQRRTFVTEADGGEWIYEYNENQTLIAIHDPYGSTRQLVLDDEGKVVSELGPDGRTRRRFLYDGAGKNYGLIDRFGYFHPPLDQEPNPPNPLVHRVASTALEQQFGGAFDANLHDETGLEELPDAIQAFASSLRRAAPAAGESRVQYDALGRTIEEIDAAGRRQAWAYDASGNVLRYTDRDGREHATEIVSWNLVGAEVDPLGRRTHYHYTAREQVARIVDPCGSQSDYKYDLKDRLVRVVYHGVTQAHYVYDAADEVIEVQDGAGQWVARYSTDTDGLVAERRLASGEVHRYAHDTQGRVIRAATAEIEVRCAFDCDGQLLADERDGRGVRHRFELGWLRETTYFGRFVVKYRREPDGSLSIEAPVGGVQRIQHDAHGRVLVTLGNGMSVLSAYDNEERCLGRTAFRTRNGDNALWSVRYTYSAEGELHRMTDSLRGAAAHCYDAAHRLVGETTADGSKYEFILDAAGNVRAKPGLPYADLLEGNRLHSAGPEQFRYDAHECLAAQDDGAGGSVRYRYNSLDMLVAVSWSGHDQKWTAAYDGLDRRLCKTYGDARTDFYWDGDRLAAEVGPTGALRIYIYPGPDALVPLLFIDYDGIDAEPAGGRAYYPLGNQIGVPLHIHDQAGKLVWWASRVEPYGAVTVRPEATISYALRFPGHYFDEDTCLHYNRFRYYSPRLGRYLQPDSIGQSGGVNVYAYSANPLVDVDVLGLMHDKKRKLDDSGSSTAAAPKLKKAKTNPVPQRILRNTKARQKRKEYAAPNESDIDLIKTRPDKDILNKHLTAIAEHKKKYEDSKTSDPVAASQHQAKVTEAIGERAATLHMIQSADGDELISGFKPGTGFDQVWGRKGLDGKITQYTIVEAKGPGASLSTPKNKGPQMSRKWVMETLQEMKHQNRPPDVRNLATNIIDAIDSGKPVVRGKVIEAVGKDGASKIVNPDNLSGYGKKAFDYN
jgi:RHS repeat-associated protein